MSEVLQVRSIMERLATIAADCFDRRAAERLRELVNELHGSHRQDTPESGAAADARAPRA